LTTLRRLDAYIVEVPLPRPLLLSHATIEARDYIVVEAEDDTGAVGRGIGYARGAPVEMIVARMLRPDWIGTGLEAYAETYERTVLRHGMQGSHGMFWRALSVADIAVHDLLATSSGQPLAEWLGGRIRPVPTTLAGCYPLAGETPASLTALMQQMAKFPSAGIKLTGSGDYRRDTERLRICREALGNGPPLIIDLYGASTDARTLIPFALQWAPLNMGWLEDPFGFDALDDLAELAAALPYPVGVGDEQSGLQHFANLVRHGRIGVVRLDATTCGGVTGFLRIARSVAAAGLPTSCHIFHHLHAQLACLFEAASIEYMLPTTGVDAIDAFVLEDLSWADQGLMPSRRPGVGMLWDETALRRYRVA
jgi:L-alanine-DL-glutamate epimerase-like enolase superfamily enzyme